ncbi:MAG: protein jag [Spirochaetales bacterium]|jgi:spoIIIJ-associated protein|nr:protein jag [Spirochaetales bacterium]
MVREFEGASEKEAIDKAIEALNLNREEFDVEIVGEEKKGLFRKGNVKIKVYLEDRDMPDEVEDEPNFNRLEPVAGAYVGDDAHPLQPSDDDLKTIKFLTEVINLMGYDAMVSVAKKEDRKVVLEIESRNTGILIGRKGKNLDALQLIANVYSGRLPSNTKVVVDAENYRLRREENLVRLAAKTADQVRRSKNSSLLEPMNPFERRLIHTSLNEVNDIDTKSEGDGLYKQVRVIYRGN